MPELTPVSWREVLQLQLIVGASALLYRFGEVMKIRRAEGFEPNSVVHSIVEGETLQRPVSAIHF